MFQVPIAYMSEAQVREALRELAEDGRVADAAGIVVSLFTDTVDTELVESLLGAVREELPQALWHGCSMNGGIARGMLSDSQVLLFVTVFEEPTTRLELVQYERDGVEARQVAQQIVERAAARPWVKGIILLTTSGSDDVVPFCNGLDGLRLGIELAGGGACDREISESPGYVFSSGGGISSNAVVALFLGGPELQVATARVSGWQPLGRELRVTGCEGTVVRSFNGRPAFEVYSHYLKIESGSGFYSNALEFPLLFESDDGMLVPHVPVRAGSEGELYLAIAVRPGDTAHIAYGDPESIRREVEGAAGEFAELAPEEILAFGCAARRKFWGDEECSGETLVFDQIAPTMGFYTGGEYYRAPSGKVHFNNTTIVLMGLREGDPSQTGQNLELARALRGGWVRKRLSVVHRMANFVNVAVADLEQANRQLAELAAADPLTGLLNRGGMQQRIETTLRESRKKAFPVSLLMLDIDNYKHVNDEFGHQRGDSVLRLLSSLMGDIVGVMAPGASLGRWGGDEFMVLLPGMDLSRARDVAEAVRVAFSAIDLGTSGSQTVSVGVVQAGAEEGIEVLYARLDEKLYQAKREGKNRVCV